MPRFQVDGGAPCALSDFLAANGDDPDVCEWARTAQPGDRFPAIVDCVCVADDRRAAAPPLTPCTTKAERLACPCFLPTGYTEPGVEHRRCETTGCGFAAFVATRGPARPSYADWAQHERDISRDAWEGYTAPGEVAYG